MPKFTNISNGPRGIYSKRGLVMVEAGQDFDGDLAEGEEVNEEWFAKAGSKVAREALAEEDASAEPEPAKEAGNKKS